MRDKKNTCFVFIGGGHRTGEVKDFIKQHELKNILQIEYQPREDLLQSLASANLHVVILGDAVSGLVHVSKIYGVMATGRPYVYIGAKESHIGDLQKTCPTGYWVKTGDVKGLETVIEEAKNLSEEKRTSIADKNILFIQDNYKIDKCLQSFYKEILQKENTVEKEIQVPSRA
jgi:glycosyltransferase involved in cell wall biosynthesis